MKTNRVTDRRYLRRLIRRILSFFSALLDLCLERSPYRIHTEIYPGIRSDTQWRRVGRHVVALEHTTLRGGW